MKRSNHEYWVKWCWFEVQRVTKERVILAIVMRVNDGKWEMKARRKIEEKVRRRKRASKTHKRARRTK